MRNGIVYFFALILFGISCSSEHDMVQIEEEPFVPISNVETKSLAISLSRDVHFSCVINDHEYFSEIPGILIIEDLLLKKEGNMILIKSEGYYDEMRYVIPSPGARLYLEVRMSEHTYFGGFNAKEGGAIVIKDIELVFAQNSIVDAEGNDFEGEVRASAKHTRSELYVTESRRFPQNNFVLNGKNHTLNLSGGVDLMLIDDMMNPLFLKEDAMVEIGFKVFSSEGQQAPDLLEVLLYDQEDEEWKRIGHANKDGERWYGNLNELGRLIWGVPYESRLAEIKCITDIGDAVPNTFVFLYTEYGNPMSIGFSDGEGNLRIYVPVNEPFVLRTFEFCNSIFVSQEYSGVHDDGEEILMLENFVFESFTHRHNYDVIRGEATNCMGEIIEESAIILPTRHGHNSIIFSDEDGSFDFIFPKCSDPQIKLSMLDVSSNTMSNEYLFETTDEPLIELGTVLICDEYEYFINYSINDREYPFPIKAKRTTVFNNPSYTTVFVANATQQSSSDNQTVIFFDHEETLIKGVYDIDALKINFDNVLYSYDFECNSECNGTVNIVQQNSYLAYEGIISHTDPNTLEVIKGAFRIPGL